MITVRDIMNTDVATVSPEMTIRELARFWDERGISGAPVRDLSGKILGVVSATDLVRFAAELPGAADRIDAADPDFPPEEVEEEGDDASWYYFLAREAPDLYVGMRDGLPDEAYDEFTVRDIMTPVVFSVRPRTTLPELARFLLRARIHRALVMERGRLVGIVTTFDVLRAVAAGALEDEDDDD
jgi:CBS domain-containing protein